MTKAEVLRYTHTRFFVWHSSINALEVSKKSLRASLKKQSYTVDITQRGIFEYGAHKGKAYYSLVIML